MSSLGIAGRGSRFGALDEILRRWRLSQKIDFRAPI
jgi:hypothetical protein